MIGRILLWLAVRIVRRLSVEALERLVDEGRQTKVGRRMVNAGGVWPVDPIPDPPPLLTHPEADLNLNALLVPASMIDGEQGSYSEAIAREGCIDRRQATRVKGDE